MSYHLDVTDQDILVSFQGTLNMAHIDELYETFKQAIIEHPQKRWLIDLSQLKNIHTCILQLLVVLKAQVGSYFEVLSISDDVKGLVLMSGFGHLLLPVDQLVGSAF